MPASTTFRNELLLLIFNNQDITGIGDAGGILGSAADGVLYMSLHTANPTSGDQETSEATYTSYDRVPLVRTASGWTVTGAAVVNAASITFPSATGGADALTYMGIGTDASGPGKLVFSLALSTTLNVTSGVTPSFGPGDVTGTVT